MNKQSQSVCILGLGYVGLTLALVLKESGFEVVAIDKNPGLIEGLKKMRVPFYEEGLESLLKQSIHDGICFETEIPDQFFDFFIICVGTPVNDLKMPVLSDIEQAATAVGRRLQKGSCVILRSTVSVGTTRNVVTPLLEKISNLKAEEDFTVSFAPERTIEGKAISELRSLPQVIGGLGEKSTESAARLFERFCPSSIKVSSLEGAEMVKMINNTYRDLTFAYSNELALICRQLHLSSSELIQAANIGYPRGNIPSPSPGVGGYCLTKDPYLLMASVEPFGYEPTLVRRAREVNESIPKFIASEIRQFLEKKKKPLETAKIFIVGFAFKGNPPTSDMRQSTTLDILNYLRHYKVKNIYGFDMVVPAEKINFLEVKHCPLEEGFADADCVVFMNNHPGLKDVDIFDLARRMKKPGLLFDGWGLFLKRDFTHINGLEYRGL